MTPIVDLLLAGLLRGTLTLALAVVALGVACRVLRPRSARLQWWCWLMTLVAGLAWGPMTLAVPWYAPAPSVAEAVPPAFPIETASPESSLPATMLVSRDVSMPAPGAPAEPVAIPANGPSNLRPMLAGAWLVGAIAFGLRWLCGYWWLVRHVRRTVRATDEWSAELDGLLEQAGAVGRIRLVTSDRLGPLLCLVPGGYRIVVPAAQWSGWTEEQRVAVLRHELAHWVRGDVWSGMLSRLLVLVHWFNPLAWLAARRLDECTEWACDDWAISRPGPEACGYAAALLHLCTDRAHRLAGAPAVAGSPAARRIRRLLETQPREDSQMKRFVMFAAAAGALAVGVVRIELVAQLSTPQAASAQLAPTQESRPDTKSREAKAVARGGIVEATSLPPDAPDSIKRYELERLGQNLLILAGVAGERLAAMPDDASAVAGIFTLLSVAEAEGSTLKKVAALKKLAERDWRTPIDPGSAENALAQLADAFRKQRDKSAQVLADLRRKYEDAAHQPWPHDWQQKEQLWRTLARHVLIACKLDAPEDYFRKRIAESPQIADWLRHSYLASVRSQQKKLDFALVGALLEHDPPASEADADNLVAVLLVAIAADVGAEHPEFNRLHRRLLDWIALQGAKVPYAPLSRALGTIYMSMLESREYRSHATALADAILKTPGPGIFATFATSVAMAPEERRARSLAKPVSIKTSEAPLARALRSLSQEVDLPLWIDAAVAQHDAKVTLETAGPWLEVVRKVLEPTPFRAHPLQSDLLWIGEPKQRAKAQTLYGQSLAHMAAGPSPIADSLRRHVTVEFDATPLRDCIVFLHEFFDVNIILLSVDSDTPVTFKQIAMPGHLLLTFLAEKTRLDWLLANGTVLVGSAEQIEAVRGRIAAYQRHHVRNMSLPANSPVRRAFWNPVIFTFDETPISDVLDFLRDYTECTFILGPVEDPDMPLTLSMDNTSLGWAFELILFRLGLTWYSDEHVVYVGDEAQVAAYQKLAESRSERRKAYPRALAKALDARVALDLKKRDLAAAIQPIAEATRIKIAVDPKTPKLAEQRLTLHAGPLPADVALDLVCRQVDLTWSIADGNEILIRSP